MKDELPKPPVPSMDDVILAGKIFVFAMLDTNAEEMTYTQNDFKGPGGKVLGSYEITVKKIK